MRRMINSNNVGGLMYQNNSKEESLIDDDDYSKDERTIESKAERKKSNKGS